MLYRGKSSFFYIFSSFIGALLVASFFAYQNYRFAKFKFINFSNTILYTQNDIFTPKQDNYYILIFSSKMGNPYKLLQKIENKENYPILILDFYGKIYKGDKNKIFLRTGTNQIISIIRKFNIKEIPVYFSIKKYNNKLFKQDSVLKIIN